MIIDTFTFGWELDLLECRLTELDEVVDLFVLVESNLTFQGDQKPLYYLDNRDRFEKWNHKIVHVVADLSVCGIDPWEKEYQSRDSIYPDIRHFADDTIVLHSDVDEFPSVSGIHTLVNRMQHKQDLYGYTHTVYSMAIDWRYPNPMRGVIGMPLCFLKDRKLSSYRKTIQDIPESNAIHDGWHFTWLGGEDFIVKKASAFSHTEDHIQSYIRDMGVRLYTEGYHVLGEKLIPVNIDDSYPQFIKNGKFPEVWRRPQY